MLTTNKHTSKKLYQKKDNGSWAVGVSNDHRADNMRDLHYKNKTIKMADETWVELREARKQSGKSWNLFLKDYLKFLNRKRKTKHLSALP